MRILFLHSIGINKYGGGEKWMILAASGLQELGHEVFVGGKPGSRLIQAALRRNIRTVSFNIKSDVSIWHILPVARFLKLHKIDLIVTSVRDLFITGCAAKFGGEPVVLVRHGLPLMNSLKKHSFLHKWLADGIITNTNSIKDAYENSCWVEKDFTKVVYNGVDCLGEVIPYNFSSQFPGKRIILTAGRLAAQKGHHILIDAARILKKKYDNILFVILGEGKLRRKIIDYAIKSGVKEHIHLYGFVDNVEPYLTACDIFVLPSLYEGMPNAALEAMACGKPIVISNVNGASELVIENETGILVPTQDPVAIASAVSKLLDDENLCLRMGDNARNFVEKSFRVETMVKNLQSHFYKKLIEKRV